jgi:hypothetical protein
MTRFIPIHLCELNTYLPELISRHMWTRNINKVFEGMNPTDNDEQIHLMKEMCKGKALTALEAGTVASYAACYEQLQDLAKSLVQPLDVAGGEMMLQFCMRQFAARNGAVRPQVNVVDAQRAKGCASHIACIMSLQD